MSGPSVFVVPVRGHAWIGSFNSLCECGWAETSQVHGMHEDFRKHLAEVVKQPLLWEGSQS